MAQKNSPGKQPHPHNPKVENQAQPHKSGTSDEKARHFDRMDEKSKEAARRDREHLASGGTIEIDRDGKKSYKR